MRDAQSGRCFDVNIMVCRSCIDKGKGCFFHGQNDLRVRPNCKQALSGLKSSPRYDFDQIAYPCCDNCSKDIRDDSLFLLEFDLQRTTKSFTNSGR